MLSLQQETSASVIQEELEPQRAYLAAQQAQRAAAMAGVPQNPTVQSLDHASKMCMTLSEACKKHLHNMFNH